MLKSRQITVRLGISFGALLAILIAVGWIALDQMDRESAELAEIQGKDWAALTLAEEALRYSSANSRITMQVFLLQDEEQIKALLTARAENSNKIEELLDKIEKQCDSDEEKKLLAAIKASRQPYTDSYKRALHLLLDEKNSPEATRIMTQETTPAMFKYHAAYHDLEQLEVGRIEKAAKERKVKQAGTHRLTLWAIVLSVVLTGMIAWVTTRRIVAETTEQLTNYERMYAKLQRSEEQFRLVLDSTAEAIYGVDLQGDCTFCNLACARLIGYDDPTELLGKNMHALIHHSHPDGTPYPVHECRIYQSFRVGEGRHAEDEVLWRKDGTSFAAEYWSHPMLNEGQLIGSVVTCLDITERVKAEERLRLWSRVLDQSAEGIFICDPQERILHVNRAFEKLTGFSTDEAVGKTPRILQSGRQDRAFYTDMWKSVLETGAWCGEMWNRRKSGELYVEWLSIGAVLDPKGAVTHYVGIFSDITIRKQADDRIVHLAHYDALTDLPNRVLLMDRLNQLIKSAERRKSMVAVVFIDLDRFKEVNDSLGHDTGDLLLQTLAKRLSSAVRDQDTVARMGGDEFVVVIQDLHDVKDVPMLVQKLLSSLVKPVTLNGYELTTTESVGISLYPDDATNGQEMIRNADAAMYQAKAAGRNAYRFYTSDLNRRALEMLSMENDLRRAIERQEFVLHYQPQVDITSGSVVGAEALIRWNHPDLGLVMPGKFISIAEERGLIVLIGGWVLEEAARQAAIWQNSGTSMPIAVNVSAVQFRQKDFVEQLTNSVRIHGITPDRLELELTESIIMRDAETTINVLQKLHDIGFQLSIDDFGTGYSSLSYLRRFPVNKIKIDQSFVRTARHDVSAGSIVTAIIGLARSLRLKVIAEGVETSEELEILRKQGCDEAQGFLFSPGLRSEEFEKLVREWEPMYPRSRQSLPV